MRVECPNAAVFPGSSARAFECNSSICIVCSFMLCLHSLACFRISCVVAIPSIACAQVPRGSSPCGGRGATAHVSDRSAASVYSRSDRDTICAFNKHTCKEMKALYVLFVELSLPAVRCACWGVKFRRGSVKRQAVLCQCSSNLCHQKEVAILTAGSILVKALVAWCALFLQAVRCAELSLGFDRVHLHAKQQ